MTIFKILAIVKLTISMLLTFYNHSKVDFKMSTAEHYFETIRLRNLKMCYIVDTSIIWKFDDRHPVVRDCMQVQEVNPYLKVTVSLWVPKDLANRWTNKIFIKLTSHRPAKGLGKGTTTLLQEIANELPTKYLKVADSRRH